MVPAAHVRPSLEAASPRLVVRWIERGGHVGFPRDLTLGLGLGASVGPGLEAQTLGWLLAQASGTAGT